ncbi:hypothetical protein [Sphingomonas sp.]|uniref:hypothetical protein n=1 Tax=Sphingomonas sp. TaxID=28214 RepID=UPI002CA76D00|nr:hypothetical protein [Sphingomonas sp.]HWK37122.1 hypothetical protein [Sphingomonas sp.]
MRVSRFLATAAGVLVATAAAQPASAQFYFQPPDQRGPPVTGAEPGVIGPALPDATPKELRAALVWNLRAGLNVAALQCQFAPYLLTLSNYNKLLLDHSDELKTSYDTLAGYFTRTAKTKKAGQTALDTYGTRVYSGFSTVGAQLTFCATSSDVGQAALFTPRGSFGTLAEERMSEMRNSLRYGGEQRFPGGINPRHVSLPPLEEKCWKKDLWVSKKCGTQPRWGGV